MQNQRRKPPIKTFGCGAVQAALWVFQKEMDGELVDVKSVTINRSYKDKETGEWANTPFLRPDQLLDAAMVATEAARHLRIRTFEPKKLQNGDSKDSSYEQTNGFPES